MRVRQAGAGIGRRLEYEYGEQRHKSWLARSGQLVRPTGGRLRDHSNLTPGRTDLLPVMRLCLPMRTWSPRDNVGLARMALARTYGVALPPSVLVLPFGGDRVAEDRLPSLHVQS